MNPVFRSAFGLTIQSDFDFSAVQANADQQPDLVVSHTPLLRRKNHEVDPDFDISEMIQYFHWASVGAFEIPNPKEIRVDPNDGVPDRLVSQPLLGIVMSVLLERRGYLCLHGGVIELSGRAAIMLGDKGAGKSTTVSALMKSGRRMLSDDLAALRFAGSDTAPIVESGLPSIKLWPDSAVASTPELVHHSHEIHPLITKRQSNLNSRVLAPAMTLGAIFLLDRGRHKLTHASRLPAPAALKAIVEHSFLSRFGASQMGQNHLADFMSRVFQTVRTTPVYRLAVRSDLSSLDDLVDTINRTMDGAP